MKRFLNFISRLFIFLLMLTLIFSIYILLVSFKNDISVRDTISYAKIVGQDMLGIPSESKINISSTLSPTTNEPSSSNISKSNNFKYYYEQLDNNSKVIYSSLEDNIDNLKKENYTINFENQFNDLLHESAGQYKLNKSFQSALDAFFYDYPELFYIDLTKINLYIKSLSIGPKTTYTVSIAPKNGLNYLDDRFQNEVQVDLAISRVENVRKQIVDSISDTSDYNKILKVHDTLVQLIDYNDSSSSHNIYGSLVDNKAVCEGYAKAFKYILDAININCILVSGNATNSSSKTEAHMWNYIMVNGNWYGVDVTWDDPIIIGSKRTTIRHDYFCKSNSVFFDGHEANGKISDNGMLFKLPTLSSTNLKK